MALKVASSFFSNSRRTAVVAFAAAAFAFSLAGHESLASRREETTKKFAAGDTLLREAPSIPTICQVRMTGMKYSLKTMALPTVEAIGDKGVIVALKATESNPPQSERVLIPYEKSFHTDVTCLTVVGAHQDSINGTFKPQTPNDTKAKVVRLVIVTPMDK
ncbi:MAG: hypothetical protein Q7S22_02080 [Candidatus Micrarchaeota archaeon]|nr:hypothetical protein [Candidatus Micrarchaeota archaeon]